MHHKLTLILGLLISIIATPSYAVIDNSTSYIEGYADALLVHKLDWVPGNYRLSIRDGNVIVTPPASWKGSENSVQHLLMSVPGIISVHINNQTNHERLSDLTRNNQRNSFFTLAGGKYFPKGFLFKPLLADPKQPSFSVSYREYWLSLGTYNIGAVDYGGTIGIYRWSQAADNGQLQIDFTAGAFSQFDLDVPSPELVNTDFTVGIPITWRKGPNSLRVTLIHQSSHLGPKYFAYNQPSNYALSFEKISGLWSHQWQQWRIYGGGGYLLWPIPNNIKRPLVQGGLEFKGRPILDGYGRLVGGLDVQSWAEDKWKPNVSLKVGIAYAGSDPAKRAARIMLEAYSGRSPDGQFYKYHVTYIGLGIYLGL